jgi:hypothetical protein
MIQLARYCGALSFLQVRHQIAVTWLAKSPKQDQVRPLYQRILQDGVAGLRPADLELIYPS